MIASLDVETTTKNKGNPHTQGNYVVLGGFYNGKETTFFDWQTPPSVIEEYLRSVKLLVLFNGKFDLAWLRVMGVTIPIDLSVWDCQLAEFYFSNQLWKYPDLDTSLEKHGLENKEHLVRDTYWNQGVDTSFVPPKLLTDYLCRDLAGTLELYHKQRQQFNEVGHKHKYRLFRIACQDLLVLLDMEYNGIIYDTETSLKKADEIAQQVAILDKEIYAHIPPYPLNLASNDHLSCLLYGGSIFVDTRVPVGTYKSGQKIGEVRYKILVNEYKLPRLVEPLKGSELAKDGYFSTDENTLRSLNAKGTAKEIIQRLLQRSKLEKLRGTYFTGLPKRIAESEWLPNQLHGQYNQSVVVSGRLSSDKPNLQNLPADAKRLCISRYRE